jgi:hypothetical protein
LRFSDGTASERHVQEDVVVSRIVSAKSTYIIQRHLSGSRSENRVSTLVFGNFPGQELFRCLACVAKSSMCCSRYNICTSYLETRERPQIQFTDSLNEDFPQHHWLASNRSASFLLGTISPRLGEEVKTRFGDIGFRDVLAEGERLLISLKPF